MLVEFASAVDAARCAVEVQHGMANQNANTPQHRRIEFRIGIHVGDIIIDEGDIFGDGVNIAARLEGIAKPGGICISDDAYRQVRGKIDIVYDDIGPQALKNIAEPMRAWSVQSGNKLASALAANASPWFRGGVFEPVGLQSEIIEKLQEKSSRNFKIREGRPMRIFILALSVLGILVSADTGKAGPSTTIRDDVVASVEPVTVTNEATQETEDQIDLDKRKRRDVQRGLTRLGFDTKVNGKFGEQTRAAITRWQTARGYPGTGFLNTQQHQALVTQIASTAQASANGSDPSNEPPSHRGGGGARHHRGGGGPGGLIGGVVGGLFR
jgi:Putative peptidoglycan binding domain/Adenylate and Guanylate cyclase catalytic domain